MLLIKWLSLVLFAISSIFFINYSSLVAQTKNIPLESNLQNLKRSVLIISHDEIFNKTLLGISIFRKFKEQEDLLIKDAEKIQNNFIYEEKQLTLSRATLSPEDFLELANDFDRRAELERLNQRNKEKIIKNNLNKWKKIFFNRFMFPIIQEFMNIYEASIVIDIDNESLRLVIFDSRINITDRVINRINNLYSNIEELTLEITS